MPFLVLASIAAIVASAERIRGRVILPMGYGRTVSRNRVFWIVPIIMASLFAWLLPKTLETLICPHCPEPYAWQNWRDAATLSIFIFAVSGAMGWVAYGLLVASIAIQKRLASSPPAPHTP
jgi:TctA family transporter